MARALTHDPSGTSLTPSMTAIGYGQVKNGVFPRFLLFFGNYGAHLRMRNRDSHVFKLSGQCGIRVRSKRPGIRNFLHLPEAKNGDTRTKIVLVVLVTTGSANHGTNQAVFSVLTCFGDVETPI